MRLQNYWLLAASYFFYGWWDWRFLTLIIFVSGLNYILGRAISAVDQAKRRKQLIYLSVISSLGVLGVFKYFNFFVDSWILLWGDLGYQWSASTAKIILPVGISFYTFQALSYTIDVYRGKLTPEKNLVNFALYISFFPQLVAGPIVRARTLLPQIAGPRRWSVSLLKEGLFQIMIGFVRKVVIADTIGQYVDVVYGNPGVYSSATLVFATILYGLQIYFDFSGYSDIAIGTAKLFGLRFQQNFNFPYFSVSLSEFWRRWHISLSSWLRDYLYVPLGGNRNGQFTTYRNLLITMSLGGLWHGAQWTFVIWGAIHGLALCMERLLKSQLAISMPKWVGWLWTLLIVMIAWVFFRSPNMTVAGEILTRIAEMESFSIFIPDINIFVTAVGGSIAGVTFDIYLWRCNASLEEFGEKLGDFSFATAVSILFVGLMLFASTSQNFIYFQF